MQLSTETVRSRISPWSAIESSLLDEQAVREIFRNRDKSSSLCVYQSSGLGEEVLKQLGVLRERNAFLNCLDDFAFRTRRIEIGTYRDLGFEAKFNFEPIHLRAGSQNISCEYLGSGHFGSAFAISSGAGARYALKIFYRRSSDLLFSGPWSELALGAYVTAKRVRNMPHLCLAKPASGWMISEFVHSGFRSRTPHGPTWEELGICALDKIEDSNNQITTTDGECVRLDYGHLTSRDRIAWEPRPVSEVLEAYRTERKYLPAATFLQLFESCPEARAWLCGRLCRVLPEERLLALSLMLCYPETKFFPINDFFGAEVLPHEKTRTVFDMLMSHEDERFRGQAVFDIRPLSEDDAAYLMSQWKNRAEFRPFLFYLGLPWH